MNKSDILNIPITFEELATIEKARENVTGGLTINYRLEVVNITAGTLKYLVEIEEDE